MKTLKVFTITCLLVSWAALTFAQSTREAMLADWKRAKAYTQAYLEAMPDSGYAFKATPETRSFAEQMLHIADANFGFAAAAAGIDAPVAQGASEKIEDKSKIQVEAVVLDSYDFVIQALEKLPEDTLKESISLFGQFEMSREAAFRKCFEHQTHHRGQSTIYLRLSGVTPPGEMLF